MCKQEKHFEEFHVNNNIRRGRQNRCKECTSKSYHEDKAYHQEYYKKNKEKIIKYQVEYNKDYKKEYRKRTHVKIARYQRKRIRELLKEAGTRKSHRTLKYIGCTTKELMSYLENKFQEGMTWENYGFEGWHIDHIRPCASFDLTDPEQQKQCFHYTNLQPLWAEENMKKHAKWDGEC